MKIVCAFSSLVVIILTVAILSCNGDDSATNGTEKVGQNRLWWLLPSLFRPTPAPTPPVASQPPFIIINLPPPLPAPSTPPPTAPTIPPPPAPTTPPPPAPTTLTPPAPTTPPPPAPTKPPPPAPTTPPPPAPTTPPPPAPTTPPPPAPTKPPPPAPTKPPPPAPTKPPPPAPTKPPPPAPTTPPPPAPTTPPPPADQKFDRSHVGVAFSPYVDPLPNPRLWNEYSIDDIKRQLNIVNNYFNYISTYSMGVAVYNRGLSWDKCDSNALVARAAAQLNQDNGTAFRVSIGVMQNSDAGDQAREIGNAFLAAQDANSISSNTVWGITFTNEYVVDVPTAQTVLDMIRKNKNRGFAVGARVNVCGLITEKSALGDSFRQIIQESDFVYCNVYPTNEHAKLGPEKAAQEVGKYIEGLIASFKQVKGSIDFRIGETGWPSQDNSSNGSDNTIQNLATYWHAINDWAKSAKVQVQFFESFDEPWKSANSQFKAEGHYGWFEKVNGDRNNHQFREKESNKIFE